MTKAKQNTWTLRNPKQAVVTAVLALTQGEQEARATTLTLRQTSALLGHLRKALGDAFREDMNILGRCAICSAGLSSDRALLVEAAQALRHLHGCGACGEGSWNACGDGGQHAERTLTAIETSLKIDSSVVVSAVPVLTEEPTK